MRFFGWLYESEAWRSRITVSVRIPGIQARSSVRRRNRCTARTRFRKDAPALSLHVQPNETLTPGASDESLHRMRTDCVGVHPGKPKGVRSTCTSGLLDEQLAECLPAHSNLLVFQARSTLFRVRVTARRSFASSSAPGQPEELGTLTAASCPRAPVVRHLRQPRHRRGRTGQPDLLN